MNEPVPPVLEMREVTRTFRIRKGIFSPKQPLHAVNGVNITIQKGEVLGLIRSCGNNPVARTPTGLLPHERIRPTRAGDA